VHLHHVRSLIDFHFGLIASSRTRTPGAAQLVDVHLDVLGNVAGQAFDFDLAADELEHAALLLDALRLALDDHRDRHLNHLVHRHAIEVGVQHFVGDRVELVSLDQHPRVAAAGQLQRDQGVGARFRVQNAQQRARVDRNRRRILCPVGGRAVEHRRHQPPTPRAPRFVLADRVPPCRFEYRFHVQNS
jgi:hypothetical protein